MEPNERNQPEANPPAGQTCAAQQLAGSIPTDHPKTVSETLSLTDKIVGEAEYELQKTITKQNPLRNVY
jgi:hypothetical protein